MCVFSWCFFNFSLHIQFSILLAIWTAAMEMLGGGGDESRDQCRKVEIMADAAYVILTRDSKEFTGNFCIDDSVLKEVGETNFDKYSYNTSELFLYSCILLLCLHTV